MNGALGILEIGGFSPAIAALDALDKAARVRLHQLELNDFNGVVLKFFGSVSDVRSAVENGRAIAEQMGAKVMGVVLPAPDDEAWKAIDSKIERSPLLEVPVVKPANYEVLNTEKSMANEAIGMIETQGFTAVFEAIDAACKAANVEVIGKEKLGGGYITVLIRGDVAAVTAAVQAGSQSVGALGKLIAAHVIARPSDAVLSLVPKA